MTHLSLHFQTTSFASGLKWLEESPLSAIFAKSSMEFLHKFSTAADRTLRVGEQDI